MSLRSGTIDKNLTLIDMQNIDGLVCECCQTDITITDKGPIGVYRDRSEKETRDIYITKLENDVWSKGKPLHLDNWKINGCPVNGPVITGSNNDITVAWYTRAGGRSNIKIARSTIVVDYVHTNKLGSEIIGGKGGGGRKDFAQAGGQDQSKIEEAFEKLKTLI